MRCAALVLTIGVLLVAAAACGSATDPCRGAGFAGGTDRADGRFAARIPRGCHTDLRRSCTVADGFGPITREIVPAGIKQDCFAFNQAVGAGLTQTPGIADGECFGVARVRWTGGGLDEHPTFRCDGARAAADDGGTRLPVAGAVPRSATIAGRAEDPWGAPARAGRGEARRERRAADWALLVWIDHRGLRCYEPGQVVDAGAPPRPRLGSLRPETADGGVEADEIGRFTAYDPNVGGSCGDPKAAPGVLVSWESRFSRPGTGAAVTALSGLAGPDVRRVEVQERGAWHAAPIGRDGAFLTVVRGIVDPDSLPARVTFGDGRVLGFGGA